MRARLLRVWKSMDRMDRYKIQKSIEDVINILDSAPMRRDLILETEIVQLTNRMPIAHLAIERGLKVLIKESGGNPENIHFLNRLLRDLRGCDKASSGFMTKAFEDTVKFFGYKVNVKGMGYLRSLDDYSVQGGNRVRLPSVAVLGNR